MAICTYCHSEKPLFAPVCHSCNNAASLTERLLLNALYYIGTLVLFVLILYWIFS